MDSLFGLHSQLFIGLAITVACIGFEPMSITRKGDYPQNYKPYNILYYVLDSHSPLEEQTKKF